MLPWLGCFRSIPCPYYISGLCDRPHCCFRHAVADSRAARDGDKFDLGDKVEEPDSDDDVDTPNADVFTANTYSSSSGAGTSRDQGSVPSFWSSQNQGVAGVSSATVLQLSPDRQAPSSLKTADPISVNSNPKTVSGNILDIPQVPVEIQPAASESENGQISRQDLSLPNVHLNIKSEVERKDILHHSNGDNHAETVSSLSAVSGSLPIKTESNSQGNGSVVEKNKQRNSHSSSKSDDAGSEKLSSKDKKSHHSSGSSSRHSSSRKESFRDDAESSKSPRSSSSSHGKHTSGGKTHSSSRSSHHTSKSSKSIVSSDKKSSSSGSSQHKSTSSKSHGSSSGQIQKTSSSHKSSGSSSKGSHKSSSSSSHKSKTDSKHKHSSSSSKHHRSSSRSNSKGTTSPKHKSLEETPFIGPFSSENSGMELPLAEWSSYVNDDQLSVNSDDAEEFLVPEDQDCDEDPSELALECLRMFTGYEPPPSVPEPKAANPEVKNSTSILESQKQENKISAQAAIDIGKKRVAHISANRSQPSNSAIKPKPSRLSLAETVARRFENSLTQCQSINSNTTPEIKVTATTPTSTVSSSSSAYSAPDRQKKRISHVPNVANLMKPKTTTSATISSAASRLLTSKQLEGSSTLSHTVKKGEQRVAHTPKKVGVPTLPRPVLSVQSVSSNSKIPAVLRQKMLDLLVDTCLEFADTVEDAYQRAIDTEKLAFEKCASKGVYHCKILNCVSTLRKEAKEKNLTGENKDSEPQVHVRSHEDMLAGPSGARHSWSIERRKSTSRLVGTDLYKEFLKRILTDDELFNNGYPRKHPSGERGRVIAVKPKEYSYGAKTTATAITGPDDRICDRCSKRFKVKKDGFPLVSESCVYHHGRKFKMRTKGQFEARYTCCDGEDSNLGCTVGASHVVSNNSDEQRGFVSAIQDPGSEETMGTSPWDIVGVDCEMIYTTHGNELARVTFVGSDLTVLYDELVKPVHPVLDYNTRFSGITEEQLVNVKTRLNDVQAVMLTRFKKNTILVGHSLESDLIALKLIHQCVVDTSVLMPHNKGPPYKRALRTLSSECLGKIIQVGEHGHDSAEDARTALEIVLWKINEDHKLSDIVKRRKISP